MFGIAAADDTGAATFRISIALAGCLAVLFFFAEHQIQNTNIKYELSVC